jgi:hypothetical protein
MPTLSRPSWVLVGAVLFATTIACSDDSTAPPPDGPTRSYRMGFTAIPPRFDLPTVIASIDMWSLRADAALMSFELPWNSLLAGVSAEAIVEREHEELAAYYRLKGHELWIYLDPANGLNRGGENEVLVRNGRSITEPEIQAMFRRFAVVIDSIIRPEHLGLTLETNLIRGASPDSLYQAIRQVANDAAADVRAIDASVKLSVSVQVDYAWGMFTGGIYQGIDQDFVDFPFIEELGLSSYPYLTSFDQPEELPLDYYTRLVEGRTIPVMVTEGGWSSETVDTHVSSEDEQRRYIERQAQLLDQARATAVFQLTFTDLDLSAWPPQPPGSILYLFARLGLVDVDLNPKPALAAWDAIFARSFSP